MVNFAPGFRRAADFPAPYEAFPFLRFLAEHFRGDHSFDLIWEMCPLSF